MTRLVRVDIKIRPQSVFFLVQYNWSVVGWKLVYPTTRKCKNQDLKNIFSTLEVSTNIYRAKTNEQTCSRHCLAEHVLFGSENIWFAVFAEKYTMYVTFYQMLTSSIPVNIDTHTHTHAQSGILSLATVHRTSARQLEVYDFQSIWNPYRHTGGDPLTHPNPYVS